MNDKKEYDFLELLCCPACKGDLTQTEDQRTLHCPACHYTFPVVDGIPVLFPSNVIENMEEMFGRFWDPEEQAELYDREVEGRHLFGVYNHESEIYGLTKCYNQNNLDIVLDAGCGNGRFSATFPDDAICVGFDASLNLLKLTKQKNRGDFLVCGELEHLPFKDGAFSTVISCRVLQHLEQQEKACHEMSRVVKDGGDIILELYNNWNLKTVYKQIRMSPRARKIFNAPFRLVFESMSPFSDWGIPYDRYNSWFQVKGWMRKASITQFTGRGVGFGYHKYFWIPFYVDALLSRKAPRFLERYYNACFAIEKAIGGLMPLRYLMEKFVIRGTKGTPGISG